MLVGHWHIHAVLASAKVTRRERFLAQMNALVPWQHLIDALSPSYFPNSAGKRGRPPTGLECMLRIYFLQQWYALADEALEDAIYDSCPSPSWR